MSGYDASSISVLEGLEAVRKRPGMYIGSTTTKGLNHLIYEIVDNSVDEHLAGACDKIWVTLEADGSCTVEDNGRGIPVGMHAKGVSAARVVFSTLQSEKSSHRQTYGYPVRLLSRYVPDDIPEYCGWHWKLVVFFMQSMTQFLTESLASGV